MCHQLVLTSGFYQTVDDAPSILQHIEINRSCSCLVWLRLFVQYGYRLACDVTTDHK